MKNKILVTGVAGFVGSHLVDRLLAKGYQVVGVDNFNDYYDPKIKEENLKEALKSAEFKLYRINILDFEKVLKIFKKEKPDKVLHLAARAGIRPSIMNPLLYGQVNVLGTVNLLKIAVESKIEQFIFGSSSSVYGESKQLPFTEDNPCENIISPYGASKRSAEFSIETFYRNFGLKSVILRFFTVYGPRGRPDMAPALFANAILRGKTINQFGNGSTSRDYTYIDDITEGIIKSLASKSDFEIINLGNNHPVTLSEFIATLEKIIGKRAKVVILPKQSGDVEITWADTSKAKKLLGWQAETSLKLGLEKYKQWLKKQI